MIGELFNFFYNLFYSGSETANAEVNIFTEVGFDLLGNSDFNMTLANYFAWLCSIISLIFIVVLCCLFVYKIIKLVGNLIR